MAKSEQILSSYGLNKTKSRIKILELLLQQHDTIALQEIEKSIPALDRITLYRNLKLFEDKGIIHRALDGTNHPKYAICAEGCNEEKHQDNHAHFHCVACEKTVCIDEISLPQIDNLPSGYSWYLEKDSSIIRIMIISTMSIFRCFAMQKPCSSTRKPRPSWVSSPRPIWI